MLKEKKSEINTDHVRLLKAKTKKIYAFSTST